MLKTLFSITAFLICMQSATVKASSWEETRLVIEDEVGKLHYLDYWSEGDDEAKSIRRYKIGGGDLPIGKFLADCSFLDSDQASLRRLRCTLWNGKKVNRVFESHLLPQSSKYKKQANAIFRKHVGKGLYSGAGGLGNEAFVCIEGCPKKKSIMAVTITCAECTMDVEACSRRIEMLPNDRKLLKISNENGVDNADIRDKPDKNGKILATLRKKEVANVLKINEYCVEIERTGDPRVTGFELGHWVKIEAPERSPKITGWIFDAHLRYSSEINQ